jgi:hypothetical protein
MMMIIDNRLIAFIKQIIVNICAQSKGYLNCWPNLMEVFFYN